MKGLEMIREKGFTLLELMFVLAIAAILMSVAVPALQMFTNNARQTGSINDFVSSMHLARNTAITTNSRVTMCSSSDGATCNAASWESGWILFRDPNSNRTVDGTETIVSSGAAADGLQLASTQYANFLTYRPNGRIMNVGIGTNTGEFTVCDSRGSSYGKVVIIDLSGRPKSSKTTRLGAAPSCA